MPENQLPLNTPALGPTTDDPPTPAAVPEEARPNTSSEVAAANAATKAEQADSAISDDWAGPVQPAERLASATSSQSDRSQPSRTSPPTPSRTGKPVRRGQGRPASPASTEDPGADLERRVGRTEFSDGALVRLRMPVRVDADTGRDILTDIDVCAVDVDERLRVSRSILECKSGRGQAGEPDRLLWLAGLRQYLGFDRAVLVRQTVSRRGRGLARTLGLRILDVPTLTSRESAHGWVPERFAHIQGPECAAAEARTDLQLKGLGHLTPELVGFLRFDALRAQPHECLRAVAALGRAADAGGVLPNPTRLVLAGHALTALLVAALSDGGRLDEISAGELLDRTRRSLVTGHPDDDQVLAILRRADELTAYSLDRVHAAYREAGAAQLPVGIPSLLDLVATPPPWVPRYTDLVEKLRANGSTARQMLQTVELAVFEAAVGGSAHEAPAFDHLFTPQHRYLLNASRRCLADIAGAEIADTLSPTLNLDFDRGGTRLGDRSAPPR